MKKVILIIFILNTSIMYSIGQNLVPNYSFEVYDTCPASYIDGQIIHAIPWTGPGGSSDYYHSCAPNTWPFHNVPYATGGFQYARTGDGYAGLSPYCNNGLENCREYIQTPLIDTLTANQCYLVSFYVSFANLSFCSVNNMSLSFTDSSFTNPSYTVVNLPSHVYKLGNPIITDTLDWVEIKGIYVSTGSEKYITIGNFKDDTHTDTLFWNSSAIYGAAYYHVDDVSVILIDSIEMQAFAGNDTGIAYGDSLFIGQEITNLYCNWYIGNILIADSVSGLYVNPTTTTTYIVEQNLCGILTYDTVTVFVSGVGINENNWSSKINVYPNPFTNNATLQFDNLEHENHILTLFDSEGRIVRTITNITQNKVIIEKQNLTSGFYFFQLRTNKEIIANGKLIIEQ